MKPEDMNTINENQKAFNGNYGAVGIAIIFTACVLLGLFANAIGALG